MPTRLRALGPLPLAAILLGALACAAPAQADLLDTKLSSAKAKKRTCQDGLASGAGVVRRSVTSDVSGLISVRTTRAGKRGGDWDVAVFSNKDGRLVAASAYRGSRELAEGVVYDGEPLTVQACRRSGRARSVRLSVSSIAVPDRSSQKIRLARIDIPNDAARRKVETLGLDLTEHARKGFREALLYSAADDEALQKARLSYTVRIADVVAADRKALSSPGGASAADAGTAVPSGRTEYRRLADFSSEMKQLAEQNPNFVKPITLPFTTLEGRQVEGIEISRDVNRSDAKPVFLQMGVHHAREWPSGEHAMEWAYEMVNGLRDGDERVTDLLGKARVIVVPIVNPDGFNLSREASFDIPIGPVGILAEALGAVEEFAYKRRNCRIQDGATPPEGACGQYENRFLGVDPNRNYGGFWGGPGASTATDDDTYRGASPFSEPETRNIKALVSRNQVTTLITNHTYSDLVLRPPGLAVEGDPPDEPVYKALGDSMAAENGYSSEKSWELYDTTGTTEDWSYYATGGLGFTFEIGKAADGPTGFETYAGSGFHPPYPMGVGAEWNGKYPGGGGNHEAYYKALESTANPERHSVIKGEAPPGSTLRLRKEFDSYTSPVISESGAIGAPLSFPDVLTSSLKVGDSGSFAWHVNPSTRPFAKKSRNFTLPSDTPASSQPIESASIVPPVQTFPIEIKPEGPKGAIGAHIDGADGDDWDLYLYEGPTIDPSKEVASSAGSSADEKLTYLNPKPGQYTLEARFFTATSGWTGAIDLYGEKQAVSLPAHEETWTLSCERGGNTVSSQEVSVARGASVDVGTLCRGGSAGTTPGQGDRPPSLRILSVKPRRLKKGLRRGLTVRFKCSEACTVRGENRFRSKRVRKRYGFKRMVLGRGRASLDRAGKGRFKLRFTRKARRRLARGKALKLTVRATAVDSAGQRDRARKKLELRR